MSKSRWESMLQQQIQALGLPEPTREFRAFPPRLFRYDFAWPQLKLAVEIDGGIAASRCRSCHGTGFRPGIGRCRSCRGAGISAGKHTRQKGIEADCEKGMLAFEDGWRVLRVVPRFVSDGRAARVLEQVLLGGKDRLSGEGRPGSGDGGHRTSEMGAEGSHTDGQALPAEPGARSR